VSFEFFSVPDVLRACCGAEVCLSIVEAVVVDVVDEHSGWNFDDEIVHLGVFSGQLFAVCERMDGVKGVGGFVDVPFVFN